MWKLLYDLSVEEGNLTRHTPFIDVRLFEEVRHTSRNTLIIV